MSRMVRVCILAVLLWAGVSRGGYVYDFEIFNNPTYAGVDTGFTVEVTDKGLTNRGMGLVGFTFRNQMLLDSSITAVYFDSHGMDSLHAINSSEGVAFSQGACPRELPGWCLLWPWFDTTKDFSADADSRGGKKHNGIDADDEWLEMVFELKRDKEYEDIIGYLNNGGSWCRPDMRIGLKVQSLNGCDSASAVNIVPEPATVLLLLIGGLMSRLKLRRG